jgi:AcrR family transcriptional regulator
LTNSTAPTKDMARVDRRILRTKKALRTALLELIEEKGYDGISVEEITQRANLGRATFYLHYKDKEDLLLEEFVEMAQERVKVLTEIPFSEWQAGERADEKQPLAPLVKVFEHAAEHEALYRVLLHGEGMKRLEQSIRALVAQSIAEIALAERRSRPLLAEPPIPLELIAAYFSGALLSSLAWWLDAPARVSPVEMAGLFQRLLFLGVREASTPQQPGGSKKPRPQGAAPRRPAAGRKARAS